MGIFDKIKSAIWGDAQAESASTELTSSTPLTSAASTSFDDPVLRDVAAAGVQPASKPVEIQTAQNSSSTGLPPIAARNSTGAIPSLI